MIEIKIYRTADNKRPFTNWYDGLKDEATEIRIQKRLRQVKLGHFGDYKSVGGGVFELRFSFGKGYRIYYAKEEDVIILLLCAGDKSTQRTDIAKAKKYWKDYKERYYETLH
jgi:putative addiction module killer protein